MIDTTTFADRYTQALLELASEIRGVGTIEAYRRYQTDARFHAQIDTLVALAMQVIEQLESTPADRPDPMTRLRKEFRSEATDLLGWTELEGE